MAMNFSAKANLVSGFLLSATLTFSTGLLLGAAGLIPGQNHPELESKNKVASVHKNLLDQCGKFKIGALKRGEEVPQEETPFEHTQTKASVAYDSADSAEEVLPETFRTTKLENSYTLKERVNGKEVLELWLERGSKLYFHSAITQENREQHYDQDKQKIRYINPDFDMPFWQTVDEPTLQDINGDGVKDLILINYLSSAPCTCEFQIISLYASQARVIYQDTPETKGYKHFFKSGKTYGIEVVDNNFPSYSDYYPNTYSRVILEWKEGKYSASAAAMKESSEDSEAMTEKAKEIKDTSETCDGNLACEGVRNAMVEAMYRGNFESIPKLMQLAFGNKELLFDGVIEGKYCDGFNLQTLQKSVTDEARKSIYFPTLRDLNPELF